MNLSVVLVGTKYSQNLGACARAMANMGGKQLILINPQCELSVESYKAAARAQKYLDQLQKFFSWGDYLKYYPHSLRVAFTVRQGKNRPVQAWLELCRELKAENIHLVFGPEDNGLADSDLVHCNHSSCLTTYGDFSSLNLAQAVLLALSAIQNENTNSKSEESRDSLQNLDDKLLKSWLLQLGFQLESPRSNAFLQLKKYFQKQPFTDREKGLFEKVLQQTLRQLKSK